MAKNPLKELDQAIFNQIDEIKSHHNYEKVKELLAQVDEEYKEPLKIISTLLFFLIPTLIIVIFLGINSTIKSELAIRKDIIKHAGQILGNKDMISKSSRGILSPTSIENFNTFNSKVSSTLSSAGIDLGKIQVSDFQSKKLSPTIVKSHAKIRISDITTKQLADVIKSLTTRAKMKVSTVSFKRNNRKKLITGTMTLNHFGKKSTSEN
ncbi:hypothetical protein N9B72_01855 [Bacteriovoracaceae bacterium]|nr:hypothetical protein [Bacteriovoracaceae bacterium]